MKMTLIGTLAAAAPKIASLLLIRKVANVTESHRPRPWSMASDETSWPGLVDPTYIGRHERTVDSSVEDPSVEDVAELFRRRTDLTGAPIFLPCPGGSTLLFMFVAQWFTDSFLRTRNAWKGSWKTDSTHEIDLCQLYGLREDQTTRLRQWDDEDRPTHLMDWREGPDGGQWPPLLCHRGAGGEVVLRERYGGDRPLHDLDRIKSALVLTQPALAHDRSALDARLLELHATGLDNGNGTLGYTAINTLFLRAHNRLAGEIWEKMKGRSGWDQERVFQTTRCTLIALLIKVVIEDYIGHIADFPLRRPIGLARGKPWARANRIAIEFNLLYRWHSMIPENIEVGSERLDHASYRFDPARAERIGLVRLLAALASQRAGRISLFNTPGFLFAKPDDGTPSSVERTVLTSRLARLRTVNDYRRHFKLPRHRSIDDMVGAQPFAQSIAQALRNRYGSIDRVELLTGLFAEQHDGSVIMGSLMKNMVAYDAFTQLLTNPLVSKRIHGEETFSKIGLELIEGASRFGDVARYALDQKPARDSPDFALGRRD